MGGGDAPAVAVVDTVPGVRLGYVDKAKGFLDVLFERGWLDPAVITRSRGRSCRTARGTRASPLPRSWRGARTSGTRQRRCTSSWGSSAWRWDAQGPSRACRARDRVLLGQGQVHLPPYHQVLLHEAHLREDSPRGAQVGDFTALSPVSAQGQRLQACVPLADGRGWGRCGGSVRRR
jgi:hypothetical protein